MPIRAILRRQANATVLLGKVTDVDTARTAGRSPASGASRYDYLVVATGARHAYFGHDEWEAVAPGLKTIEDATEIRAPHPPRLREGRGRATTRTSAGGC